MRQTQDRTGSAPRNAARDAASAAAPGKHTLVEIAQTLAVSTVQRKATGDGGEADVHAAAAHGISGSSGPLPHRDLIQQLFGPNHDVSGIRTPPARKARRGGSRRPPRAGSALPDTRRRPAAVVCQKWIADSYGSPVVEVEQPNRAGDLAYLSVWRQLGPSPLHASRKARSGFERHLARASHLEHERGYPEHMEQPRVFHASCAISRDSRALEQHGTVFGAFARGVRCLSSSKLG